MGERAPYSRVYWSVVDDPKFATIYDDDRHLATWLRLLIGADAIWPASATLPSTARKASVEALVDAELIDLLPGRRYRIHGLDAERGRRRDAATTRKPDGDRPGTTWSPNGPSRARDAMLVSSSSSSENVEEGTLRARPLALPVKGMDGTTQTVEVGSDPVQLEVHRLQRLAEELTGRPYVMANVHGGLGEKAVTEQLPHGFERVEAAWRRVAAQVTGSGSSKPTLRQLVLGADDILNPVPQADAREQRTEQANRDFDRRVARTKAYIASLTGEPEPA